MNTTVMSYPVVATRAEALRGVSHLLWPSLGGVALRLAFNGQYAFHRDELDIGEFP